MHVEARKKDRQGPAAVPRSSRTDISDPGRHTQKEKDEDPKKDRHRKQDKKDRHPKQDKKDQKHKRHKKDDQHERKEPPSVARTLR